MALVTMQDVLKVAEEKKIAIAAFTVDTLEVAEEIASVAEEKQLPAIMMVGQNTFKQMCIRDRNCACEVLAIGDANGVKDGKHNMHEAFATALQI